MRRDLHRHPEIAFQEVRTAAIIAEKLSGLGFEVQTGVGKTGVVAVLEGAADGRTVLWRADMDALPVQEENQTDYVSTVSGRMHACGHDGHVSIALGIARLLAEHRDSLKGRVKFVFQPAEEIVAGAQAMIADGVLDAPRPDVSLGLHLWNELPVGTVGVTDGAVMAASSNLIIRISGKGGHAAMPHRTADPVVCAAQIISALQTIVSRNVDPAQTAVVSITQLKGSNADNIIPECVELGGSLRAYSLDIRDHSARRIHEIAESISQAMGCTAEVKLRHGTIPVINSAEVTAQLRETFAEVVGASAINTDFRTMASEDMSFFMDGIPGAYFFVGSANSAKGLDYPHHHARFDIDEESLALGVALGAAAIGSYLF
ncbi:MAG: amidohydrolase [Anaerolineaceae bacterium]|nr:MAG: amidohydrolase [Anaerolineaceae bacterium]